VNVDQQTAIAALAGALAILALVLAFALWRVRRAHSDMRTKLRRVLAGSSEGTLEQLLERNFDRLENLEKRVDALNELQREADRVLGRALQRVGVVRYNAFQDTGGDQSFALALLDNKGNGVVVNSLHGRSETRLYAKPVVQRASASAYTLSNEEAEAIRRAMSET
jgi:Flp pilus assembly protein TadB